MRFLSVCMVSMYCYSFSRYSLQSLQAYMVSTYNERNAFIINCRNTFCLQFFCKSANFQQFVVLNFHIFKVISQSRLLFCSAILHYRLLVGPNEIDNNLSFLQPIEGHRKLVKYSLPFKQLGSDLLKWLYPSHSRWVSILA